jgi:hypothetical protein
MKVLIIEAPEVKIFQPNLAEKLLDKPDQIYVPERIEIVVPRTSGNIKFTFGMPRIFGGPIGSDKEQIPTEIIRWLSEDPETDAYGVAALDLSDETFSAYVEAVFMGMANESKIKTLSFPEAMKQEMMEAKKRAKIISRERVYRVIRRQVEHATLQASRNREGGIQDYEPSSTEWLCKYAMRKELQEKADKRQRLKDELDKPLSVGLTEELQGA